MFVGREKERIALTKYYKQEGSAVVVVYGREGIGKTTLLREFLQDKPFVYYQARELSREEQYHYFEQKQNELMNRIRTSSSKLCFVIDEFDLIQKGNKEFLDDLQNFYAAIQGENVLMILTSSCISWVEHQMADQFGKWMEHVVETIKLQEFSFMEMVDRFPQCSTKDCIAIYSILGGVPAYLAHWDPQDSIRRNVIRLILDDKGILHKEAGRFLKTSLRELPFYNTILSVLAEDEPKLNYLYQRTGFSRAKISVYIKNLTQMDVAAKIHSFQPENGQIGKKGLYEIRDRFLAFWYKLVYPNLSELSLMTPEKFYEQYIKDAMDEVERKTYGRVCQEFMDLMNQYGRLPQTFGPFAGYFGKEGDVPLVAVDDTGMLMVGDCYWQNKPYDTQNFKELLKAGSQLGKDADYYYLFSKEGFSSDFAVMASQMNNIECIDLEDM